MWSGAAVSENTVYVYTKYGEKYADERALDSRPAGAVARLGFKQLPPVLTSHDWVLDGFVEPVEVSSETKARIDAAFDGACERKKSVVFQLSQQELEAGRAEYLRKFSEANTKKQRKQTKGGKKWISREILKL